MESGGILKSSELTHKEQYGENHMVCQPEVIQSYIHALGFSSPEDVFETYTKIKAPSMSTPRCSS